MRKHLFLIILFFAFSTLNIFADETPVQDFGKANSLYQKGNYQQAADLYQGIIDKGFESAEVYFNLGNSYFKMNKIPAALLNFERAKRLAPGDEDIDFNLKVASLKIVDKIEPMPRLFIYDWIDSIRSWFTSTGWSITTIIFSWITFIALAGFIIMWKPFNKKIMFALAGISFLIMIFSFTFAQTAYKSEEEHNTAIVFAPSVYVKSSPDVTGTDLFILHEGTKVQILDRLVDKNGSWNKIRLANGNIGWLQAESIEII